MHRLTIPIPDNDIRALHAGDPVALNGIIITGRDAAHKFMVEHFIKGSPPPDEEELYGRLQGMLNGGVIYHCGPVVKQHDDGSWSFVAAGLTTSIRRKSTRRT